MADTKISALSATTTLEDTDLLTAVTGIGGTPTNKAITVSNLRTEMQDGLSIPTDISELTDTTNIIPADTNDLTNGAGFITSADIPTIPDDVSDLADSTGITLPSYSGASDGDVLTIDTGAPIWSAPSGGSSDATSLQGFGITETDPTDGKILVYRTASSAYVLEDKPASGSNPAMADISDYTPTDIGDNDIIAYDSTAEGYINQTPAELGFATVATSGSYTDLSNTPSIPADLGDLTDTGGLLTTTEEIQDVVGAMVSSNTETNITVSYEDGDGTLDFSVANASDTTKGVVELATIAETTTGTSTTLAVTPDGLHDMTSLAGAVWFLDEDNMASNSATKVASQQSVKAYVDGLVGTEAIQDIVGAMVSSNTETGITVTYEDGDGTLDFVVASQTDNNFTTALKNKLDGIEASADVTDATNVAAAGAAMSGGAFHDGFSDFVANEHIDWTGDQGATNIHAGNIPDLSGTYKAVGANETANVNAATTSAAGKAELATTAETTSGTDTDRVVTPDGLSGSIYGRKTVYIKVIAEATALAIGDGKAYFTVPVDLNGMNLVDVDASVYTVSSSGTPTIQIRNVTDSQDMLSTTITIDANEFSSYTAATAPVINTSYDDVATGDRLAIDVDGAGTGTKGLDVILVFQTP